MEVKKVLVQVEKDNIKFINLQFTDLLGVIKEIIIPVEQLEDASGNGVWFDGSSVGGFARIEESDLFLKPDMVTYAVVLWLTQDGKTARLICDIYRSDGKPFEGDPRFILKQAGRQAAKEGFEYNVGPETAEENIYTLDDESLLKKNIGVLPTSLCQALDELKKNKLIREVLGEHLFERYIDVKTKEWDEFKKKVTTWEIDTYLDAF